MTVTPNIIYSDNLAVYKSPELSPLYSQINPKSSRSSPRCQVIEMLRQNKNASYSVGLNSEPDHDKKQISPENNKVTVTIICSYILSSGIISQMFQTSFIETANLWTYLRNIYFYMHKQPQKSRKCVYFLRCQPAFIYLLLEL